MPGPAFLALESMTRSRDSTSPLLWIAGVLVLAWGFLWMIRGMHGLGVHLLLGSAFALTLIWGLLRAR